MAYAGFLNFASPRTFVLQRGAPGRHGTPCAGCAARPRSAPPESRPRAPGTPVRAAAAAVPPPPGAPRAAALTAPARQPACRRGGWLIEQRFEQMIRLCGMSVHVKVWQVAVKHGCPVVYHSQAPGQQMALKHAEHNMPSTLPAPSNVVAALRGPGNAHLQHQRSGMHAPVAHACLPASRGRLHAHRRGHAPTEVRTVRALQHARRPPGARNQTGLECIHIREGAQRSALRAIANRVGQLAQSWRTEHTT